jgi:NAD(P)-dependent dehydrogenase (short-subunit alcohol dehydrogenase family)
MELDGKIALVTGGGSGIGLGIALALAGEGCQVVISGRRQDKLDAAAGQFDGRPPIRARACDVADRQHVGRLFAWVAEQLGPPEILVNSAGINVPNRRMADLDPAHWDRVLAVNASGAFNCIYAALPAMRERKSGLVVNVSSIAGKRALEMSGIAYCASKFAMTALGTAVGLEERANGIRVTNIYPGEVDTPILDQRPTPVPAEKRARMVHPEDIGACVVAIARLPDCVLVPELIITPLYQGYA